MTRSYYEINAAALENEAIGEYIAYSEWFQLAGLSFG
jgi:hypothetical protein